MRLRCTESALQRIMPRLSGAVLAGRAFRDADLSSVLLRTASPLARDPLLVVLGGVDLHRDLGVGLSEDLILDGAFVASALKGFGVTVPSRPT